MEDIKKLNSQVETLVIFRNLLGDKVISNLIKVLSSLVKRKEGMVNIYSDFVHSLLQKNEDLTDYIWKKVLKDENVYVLKKSKDEKVSSMMEECITNELNILKRLADVKSNNIKKHINYNGFLPGWTNSQIQFEREYRKRMCNLSITGYGTFADNFVFIFDDRGLNPVKFPDNIRLSDLVGYEIQRKKVIDNTLTFLQGKLSCNVLLYGDAGTGKSSTVKAIINEYGHLGLRLIEIRKSQLLQMPVLLERLSSNPLKFILFVDDLSFAQTNEEIGALKAILEGSVTAKTANIVIYATSNRRRLIRETFSERGDDEINKNETIQEQSSLSERFGLSVSFFRPRKDEYLHIVFDLAEQYQLKNKENLELLAERYALERGGRSGRCARQLIEYLKSLEK